MMISWKTLPAVFMLAAVLAVSPAAPALAFGSDDSDSSTTTSDDDKKDGTEGKAIREIRDLLDQARFGTALDRLIAYTAARPDDPDGWNLRGYASRKLGRFDMAFGFYERALALKPDHKGALEYLGELYVQMGQPETARALLARLETLCPAGCEQSRALRSFIDGGSEAAARRW